MLQLRGAAPDVSLISSSTAPEAEVPVLQHCRPRNANLNGIVDRLWCVSDTTADGYETLLPSAKPQVLFSLSDIPLVTHDPEDDGPEADVYEVFQGPSSRPRRVSRRSQIALCGISFCPGGAGAVFGGINETADRVIALRQFWGEDAARFNARLRSLNSDGARFDFLEDELLWRISDTTEIEFLARGIQLLEAGHSVDHVCRELGCSPYIFRKAFLRNVGLSPKRYLRIERFRAAVSQISSTASLADVASEMEFSDQAHMTRETHQFARMTPGRLRASNRPYAGHVLDD